MELNVGTKGAGAAAAAKGAGAAKAAGKAAQKAIKTIA